MYTQAYAYFDAELGRQVRFHLRGGQWIGDECVFEFVVPARGIAGIVRCDWRRTEPTFELTDGTQDDPITRAIEARLSSFLPGFHQGPFDDLTDAQLRELYTSGYHERQNYSANSAAEAERKGFMADLTIALARPRKVLVVGCSAGECIRQLRTRDVESFGFDLSADIAAVAYPEVREFVRVGSATAMPFGPEDGFDTATAFDVFEHIPAGRVPDMVREFVRLRVRTIVALIAHCEYGYEGHVTLRPISWWDRMLGPFYRRVPNHELPIPWPAVEAGGADTSKLLRVYAAV